MSSDDYILEGETLSKYIGSDDTIIIPENITAIGVYAFAGNGDIKTVIIPDSVTTICKYAFQSCKNLSYVEFGKGLTDIGPGAFDACTALDFIDLSGTHLNSISRDAFRNCSNAKQVSLPDTLQVIESSAFNNCVSIEEFDCPSSVKTVGESAFEGIKRVVIDNNLKDQMNRAMLPLARGGSFISTLVIRSMLSGEVIEVVPVCSDGTDNYFWSVIALWKRNGIDQSIQDEYFGKIHNDAVRIHIVSTRLKYPFLLQKKHKDTYLKYLKKNIDKYKKRIIYDSDLFGVVLENKMIGKTKVDDFYEEVQKTGDSEKTLIMMNYLRDNFGMGFDNYEERIEAKENEKERIARMQEEAAKRAEEKKLSKEVILKDPYADLKAVWTVKRGSGITLMNYKGKAEHLIVPAMYEGYAVREIKKTVKSGYPTVKKITLPDTVQRLSTNAFSFCGNLETVDLGKGLKWVDNYAFMGCEKLKEVVFPEGVNWTSKWMFRDCKSLEKVVFLNKEEINYQYDCNFLRGSRKAKIYVYEGTKLKNFALSEDRIIRMNEDGETISTQQSDTLQDMIVVHTGFSAEDEQRIEKVTYTCGGTIKGSVVLKTDILVYNPDYDHETTKLKRAKELNESGKNIRILTKEEFMSLAGVDHQSI